MLKIKRVWKKGSLSRQNMENESGSGQKSILHKTVFYKQARTGDGMPTALHDSLEFSKSWLLTYQGLSLQAHLQIAVT